MQIMDGLTLHELVMMREYINAFADRYNATAAPESMKFILQFWEKNKQSLWEMFGEKLILENTVDIKKPVSMIVDEILDDVIMGKGKDFIRSWTHWITRTTYCNDFELYRNLSLLIASDTLAKNKYEGEDVELSVPGGKHPIQIANGCKPIRVLSKIATHFNLEGFEEFRLAHSMVLNRKTFKGTICLSIHPLDYMTMSDNDCDWDSCMSWKGDGEYRRGTVECMNSPYIVVAYLKKSQDMELVYDYEWNNKRWRKLFVVHPKALLGIRGYPYNDDNLDNEVLSWLLELANNYGYEYYDDLVDFKDKGMFSSEYPHIQGTSFSVDFNTMYNDLLYGKVKAYIGKSIGQEERHSLQLYGENNCMFCGRDFSNCCKDIEPDVLSCPECRGLIQCEICGYYIDQDDIVLAFDGTQMCQCCAEDYEAPCAVCEDVMRRKETKEIYLYHCGRVKYFLVVNVCEDCIEEFCNHCGPISQISDEYGCKLNCVESRNLTSIGYRLFDILHKRERFQREIEDYNEASCPEEIKQGSRP